MDKVIAELERLAEVERAREAYNADLLYRALALALRNGGGCHCSWIEGTQEWLDTGGWSEQVWTLHNYDDCPLCHGSGISDEMRELLHQLGVEVGQ